MASLVLRGSIERQGGAVLKGESNYGQSLVKLERAQFGVLSLDSGYKYERAIRESTHGTLLMHNPDPQKGTCDTTR